LSASGSTSRRWPQPSAEETSATPPRSMAPRCPAWRRCRRAQKGSRWSTARIALIGQHRCDDTARGRRRLPPRLPPGVRIAAGEVLDARGRRGTASRRAGHDTAETRARCLHQRTQRWRHHRRRNRRWRREFIRTMPLAGAMVPPTPLAPSRIEATTTRPGRVRCRRTPRTTSGPGSSSRAQRRACLLLHAGSRLYLHGVESGLHEETSSR
jgi:hypothetical protein